MRHRTAALTLLLLAAASEPAFAHGHLKSSSPASGETVTKPLSEIRLDFTERPELAFTSIRLVGPDSSIVQLGTPRLDGNSIFLSVDARLTAGDYVVTWKTAGKDGHAVWGRYGFSVSVGAYNADTAMSSSAVPPSTQSPGAPHHDPMAMPGGRNFDSQSPGYVILRWAQYIALLTLIGVFAFRFVVLAFATKRVRDLKLPDTLQNRLAKIAVFSAASLALLGVIRLIAQSFAMHGENQSVISAMLPMITGTTWGGGWIAQMLGALVVLSVFLSVRKGKSARWTIGLIGLAGCIIAPALSGHAASVPDLSALAITADAFHILGAGGWLGSLLIVLVVGIPATAQLHEDERHQAVATIVNSFSTTALIFAAMAAASGVFAAWLHVNSIRAFWETTYGRTLLLKLGILSIVAATGAYNWLRVKPSLGTPSATRRLRVSATIELAVAVAVIGVTAVLVALPTSVDEELMRPSASSFR